MPPATGMERITAYGGECETEGTVDLIMPPGKKLDHNGIMVKFFGRIDMVSSRCGFEDGKRLIWLDFRLGVATWIIDLFIDMSAA